MSDQNELAAGAIKNAIVIDDDEVARNLIANYVKKLGVEEIDMAETGDAAWDLIRSRQYQLIVLDWKLPGLSGLALFNRIRRSKAYRTVPLLVVSGFLEKDDFRLLQEFPCTALMEKPFTKVLFDNRVSDLMREHVWYGQNVALVDTIMDAVQDDDAKTEALIKQVLKKAPNPVPLAVLSARRLVKRRKLKAAEKILRGVLKIDENCVIAINELGKVLHLLGRHKQSLETLRQANKLSPQNLSRLCLMGEVELNLKDPESAAAYFERVLEIDEGNEVAKSGVVVAGNMRELLEAPTAAQVSNSFASMMNTLGIAYVRNGDFARGIEQYQSAMAFIRSGGDSARVAFNLGLGYLRWGKPSEALPWFQKSEQLATDGFAKSAGYVTKLLANGGGKEALSSEEVKIEGTQPARVVNDRKKDNVIPFPVSEERQKKKKDDDDLLEETVGTHEMVLRSSSDIAGFEEDEAGEGKSARESEPNSEKIEL